MQLGEFEPRLSLLDLHLQLADLAGGLKANVVVIGGLGSLKIDLQALQGDPGVGQLVGRVVAEAAHPSSPLKSFPAARQVGA